jgi:hypothetical protein
MPPGLGGADVVMHPTVRRAARQSATGERNAEGRFMESSKVSPKLAILQKLLTAGVFGLNPIDRNRNEMA